MYNKHKILEAAERYGTPLYVYDTEILDNTLDALLENSGKYHIHFAVKSNNNPEILRRIAARGIGADCVSGGEVSFAIECGIAPEKIHYAGVGKTDGEILFAMREGIGAFNVESVEELHIISEIAAENGLTANVALRINPDIDAHTHHYITTGLADNKFGISMDKMDEAVKFADSHPNLNFRGLHFHIGSQILTPEPYRLLAEKINELVSHIENELGIEVTTINTGGGLGINYDDPDSEPVPDFSLYFAPLLDNIRLREGQELHCEPGRSISGQCGTLLAKVQYVKSAPTKKFVILDAGMNNLIRPALYQASHHIENLTSGSAETEKYDVVGPVCESADEFATDRVLPVTGRGDIIAIRSAGAYGSTMSSGYNMRQAAKEILI